MNYIGSKLKLCQDFIPKTIKSVCGKDLSNKVFCDLFAGTGIVGRTFKTMVKKVIANDIEYYSYVINKNYIERDESPGTHREVCIDEMSFDKKGNIIPIVPTQNGPAPLNIKKK